MYSPLPFSPGRPLSPAVFKSARERPGAPLSWRVAQPPYGLNLGLATLLFEKGPIS